MPVTKSVYTICTGNKKLRIERKSPQQYANLRHGLREQMQILQFEPAIPQPVNVWRVIYKSYTQLLWIGTYGESWTYNKWCLKTVAKGLCNSSSNCGFNHNNQNDGGKQYIDMCPEELHVYEHSNTRKEQSSKEVTNRFHLQNSALERLSSKPLHIPQDNFIHQLKIKNAAVLRIYLV